MSTVTTYDASAVLRRCPLPLALVEPANHTILEVNLAFAELVQVIPQQFHDVDMLSLLGAEDRALAAIVLAGLTSGAIDSCHGRAHLRRSDGSEIEVREWVGTLPEADFQDLAWWALVPVQDGSTSARPAPLAPLSERGVIGTVDHAWTFQEISADAIELLGWNPEEQRGTPLVRLVHPNDAPALMLCLARSTAERRGMSTRIQVQGPGDAWIPVYCELSPLCEHTPPSFAVVMRRAVEETQAEQAHTRAARLEQHLWRIGMEVQAAGVIATPAIEAWWADPALRHLSPRQWEVLQRVMQGERVANIAHDLYISRSTVRNHLTAIYRLLDVHSRPELVERLRYVASESA